MVFLGTDLTFRAARGHKAPSSNAKIKKFITFTYILNMHLMQNSHTKWFTRRLQQVEVPVHVV